MSDPLNIQVDGEIQASLREYVHANLRLNAYKPGSHAYDQARFDVLLRADTLAYAIARQVGALKGIQE